jgi:lipopolysaccharide export system protein LptC
MRERLTSFIAIALLALITATSYWYARALKAQKAGATVTQGAPDAEADQLVITQFDSQGRARHKLFAEKMLHYMETDNAELTQPRLVSLRPDQPQVEVRAQRALVENSGERIHMHGQVDVRRSAFEALPAMRLQSQYLLVIPDYDRYATDLAVTVDRGSARITSSGGMQLDNIARIVQFDGDVQMTLPPAGEP